MMALVQTGNSVKETYYVTLHIYCGDFVVVCGSEFDNRCKIYELCVRYSCR